MKIEYSKAAIKIISALDKRTQIRMKQAIEAIPRGDIKSLKGTASFYRLRVGDWRIVFRYLSDDTIFIEKIAPRGDVYKGGLLH